MESLNFGSKKLGFGCMRLPMTTGTVGGEGTVDTQQVCEMVDAFLAQGFAILTPHTVTSPVTASPHCGNVWWNGILETAIC